MIRTARHSGFLLLEVVVAVGLLVVGLAVIGAQIQSASMRTHKTDQLAKVVFLAESKIAEIDTGMVPPERETEKDFGRLFPAYAWRLLIEPTDNIELIFLQLEILHDPLRDPDEDFDFDSETAEVLKTYYTLRAVPRQLDLTIDFGMDEALADKMNEDLAGIGGGGIDVREFNPSIFRELDMQEILEVLPVFMQALNLQQADLINLLPEEMRPQIEALLSEYAAGAVEDETDGGDGTSSSGGLTGGEGNPDTGSPDDGSRDEGADTGNDMDATEGGGDGSGGRGSGLDNTDDSSRDRGRGDGRRGRDRDGRNRGSQDGGERRGGRSQ